jgi:hypothetical protein
LKEHIKVTKKKEGGTPGIQEKFESSGMGNKFASGETKMPYFR